LAPQAVKAPSILLNCATYPVPATFRYQTHIQLLEVDGFAWILFLWNNVQDHFNSKIPVRLDKIAHANITWNNVSLREMVEARIRFFSRNRYGFRDLLQPNLNADEVFRT
jgi:hypothetical protein